MKGCVKIPIEDLKRGAVTLDSRYNIDEISDFTEIRGVFETIVKMSLAGGVPVTFVEDDHIYQSTNDNLVEIKKISPLVNVGRRTYRLK